MVLPPARSMAISAARLPSSRESFQTETVCVPSAMRFRAALSASWPETGTEPARPWASRAATAPPAVPSLEATTRVNLVVVGGQELLHVALRVLRQPAVRVGFADILDLAGVDGGLQHFHLAGEQEVGVRVGRRALDEDVVAFRLGLEALREPACGRLPCCRR